VHFGTAETVDLSQLREALERAGRIRGPYVAVGHSLGAAIALRWQAADPAVSASVALGAPRGFVASAVRLRDEYADWLPRSWVRRGAKKVPRVLGVEASALDTECALQGHPVLAFLVAGQGDVITPPEDSEALRRRLGPGSAFLIVGPTTHEVLPFLVDQYGRQVREWLAREVDPGQDPSVGTGSP
jgi:pimeloyl-ACP methyl ester carboxylesterase